MALCWTGLATFRSFTISVGALGFEPRASCTPCKRASRSAPRPDCRPFRKAAQIIARKTHKINPYLLPSSFLTISVDYLFTLWYYAIR